jgi:protein-disulfide isomerase
MMKPTLFNRIGLVTLTAGVILVLGLSHGSAQTPASPTTTPTTQTMTKEQRETIEKVIREYLLSHPSVIRDAFQALQAQEEKERRERTAHSLKTLESDLYSDPDSPVAGNPKGDVTIVVFSDYNCGYCRSTLPILQTLSSKDQSIKVVYKELPILSHQSRVAAQAALAANRQGKYTAFHNGLLQSERASDEEIKSISDRLGLNYATLKKDMADPRLNEALDRNLRLARALEIDGTPALIVGQQVIPGAIDMDSLARVVSAERAKLAKASTGTDNSEPKK